jgi:glycosyltransferase involved in cell wall biosynthesis
MTPAASSEPIQASQVSPAGIRAGSPKQARHSVYLMDLWSFIPYYMARLAASLREQGMEVSLGSVRYHLQRNYFRISGIERDPGLLDLGGCLKVSWLRRVVKSIEYALNLCGLAFRFLFSAPDVLHIEYLPFLDHGFSFEIWFMRWVRQLRIPIVYTVHNVTYQGAPKRYRPIYRRAYHTADTLVCHGEQARAELVRDFGIAAERIEVIPHGPLFESQPKASPQIARGKLGFPEASTLVLCQGVLSEYKGIPFLLDAWKRLAGSQGNARLVIAGTGDARLLSAIRGNVAADGLTDTVDLRLQFIPVEQLPLFYQAADILVYPYREGTTSGALLTGMNYGKAIVATTLPFFVEHLEHERTALFVEYGDVDGLAKTLKRLIDNPSQREKLGRGVAARAENGKSWDAIARATIDCYSEARRSVSR